MTAKPDYGIDAPTVVRNLALAGVALTALALWGTTIRLGSVTLHFPRSGSLLAAAIFFAEAGLMLYYSKRGKLRMRDRMLARVDWAAVSSALDVGTGRGLLLAGVAKRIPNGRAVGIDIWKAADLSDNAAANTQRNLEAEGVAGNTELHSEDARHLSFPDGCFDLVVSSLCIHNIHGRGERARALAEIVRVTRPGGQILIADFIHTREYLREFLHLGLEAHRTATSLREFPPIRTVVARVA